MSFLRSVSLCSYKTYPKQLSLISQQPLPDFEMGVPSRSSPRRPQLIDVLVDLRRTMEALDEARMRVASILNLPEPSLIRSPLFDDFMDPEEFSRIRRKNSTCLDDAILRCLTS